MSRLSGREDLVVLTSPRHTRQTLHSLAIYIILKRSPIYYRLLQCLDYTRVIKYLNIFRMYKLILLIYDNPSTATNI